MALIIDTASEKAERLAGQDRFFTYCALDSCITREVLDKISPRLDGVTDRTYRSALALQAPVMSMMRNGVLIDQKTRVDMRNKLDARGDVVRKQLHFLIDSYIDCSIQFGFLNESYRKKLANLNPNSSDQVKFLFYEVLGMPPVLNDKDKPTVDRNALEKLARFPLAQPFVKLLLEVRDIGKMISWLGMELDLDGRFRTTLGIAGTTTGRFNSNKSISDTGSNSQNVDPLLRCCFVADEGKKLAYVDLEQAEARLVGARVWNLFGDSKYLDATENPSVDTHTAVAMQVWPHLKSRADAEQLYYRNFSYRFICKRLGFGLNLIGQPRGLAQQTQIEVKEVERFSEDYFGTFPGIRRWHHWAAQQIADPGYIVSMMGRKRWFFGRPNDDATIRQAVAFDAQEPVAKIINMGIFRLWWNSYRGNGNLPIDLFFQVHDAVLLQYPEELEDELIPQIQSLLRTPLLLRNKREFTIPTSVAVGWNWGEA